MSEQSDPPNPEELELLEKQYGSLSHLGGPQTPIRVGILGELQANGPLSRRELRDIFVEGDDRWDFEVSKPTLYRQFDEDSGDKAEESLVERGWVMDISESKSSESRYELTPKGRLVYEEVSSFLDTFERIEHVPPDIEPFLEVITKSEFEMEQEVLCGLADAEVYAATPTNLYGLFSEFDEFASQGELIRGISWVSSELFVNQFYNYVVEKDKHAELILTSEVLQNLVESHRDRWREIIETGSMDLFECDVYPFGLTVVEHGVAWGYFEPEKGSHEYELICESDAVQKWASEVFEKFKKRGRMVTEEQLEKTKQ